MYSFVNYNSGGKENSDIQKLNCNKATSNIIKSYALKNRENNRSNEQMQARVKLKSYPKQKSIVILSDN